MRMTALLSATRIGDWRPLSKRCFAPTYSLSNVRDRSVQQEEVMRFGYTAIAAAALCAALTGTAFAQDSVEDYDGVGCAHMQKKFAVAFDANQKSANSLQARYAAASARGYCSR